MSNEDGNVTGDQHDPVAGRIEALSKGFEKLAFTIASKMGSLQRVMNEINDRFKRFEGMMLDVSSFEQQFRKLAGTLHVFEDKLEDIGSSVASLRVSQQGTVQHGNRTVSSPLPAAMVEGRTSRVSLLSRIQALLKEPATPDDLADKLDEVKRQAFTMNGGSVMLYKLGEEIKRLRMEAKNDSSFSIEAFARDLHARVDEWLSSMEP